MLAVWQWAHTWALTHLLAQTSPGYSEQWRLNYDPDHMTLLPVLTWEKVTVRTNAMNDTCVLALHPSYYTCSRSWCLERYLRFQEKNPVWRSRRPGRCRLSSLDTNDKDDISSCWRHCCSLTSVLPMKVSARLTDWEEMAILKPRPSAGMMVDWQMKLSTELTNWATSLCSSLLDTSVMLSVQVAALLPCHKQAHLWLIGCYGNKNVCFSISGRKTKSPRGHTGWRWTGEGTLCLSRWNSARWSAWPRHS